MFPYFNSRPHGGRLALCLFGSGIRVFQLTPSRRATVIAEHEKIFVSISTHALTEGDRTCLPRSPCRKHFNSRPHGGRRRSAKHSASHQYFNSRPHGGRQRGATEISNAESFQLTPSRRATPPAGFLCCFRLFQLTPSRRATVVPTLKFLSKSYFNSRPHGGRPDHGAGGNTDCISTHALTEGDDDHNGIRQHYGISTHALTEGDEAMKEIDNIEIISTHALTEGDEPTPGTHCSTKNFNSRPHGGRRLEWKRSGRSIPFQLTPSRRATFQTIRITSRSLFQLTPSRRATGECARS